MPSTNEYESVQRDVARTLVEKVNKVKLGFHDADWNNWIFPAELLPYTIDELMGLNEFSLAGPLTEDTFITLTVKDDAIPYLEKYDSDEDFVENKFIKGETVKGALIKIDRNGITIDVLTIEFQPEEQKWVWSETIYDKRIIHVNYQTLKEGSIEVKKFDWRPPSSS